jgi:hypothetical protein
MTAFVITLGMVSQKKVDWLMGKKRSSPSAFETSCAVLSALAAAVASWI